MSRPGHWSAVLSCKHVNMRMRLLAIKVAFLSLKIPPQNWAVIAMMTTVPIWISMHVSLTIREDRHFR